MIIEQIYKRRFTFSLMSVNRLTLPKIRRPFGKTSQKTATLLIIFKQNTLQ